MSSREKSKTEQEFYDAQVEKAKSGHISGVSKSYSGVRKSPHEVAFDKENRYLNAPTILVINHDTGHSNNINLYDLIDGMSNPIENGIQWAELWYAFKSKQLEFKVVESVG